MCASKILSGSRYLAGHERMNAVEEKMESKDPKIQMLEKVIFILLPDKHLDLFKMDLDLRAKVKIFFHTF